MNDRRELWADHPQAALFDDLTDDWRREWWGMPEYSHEDLTPYRSLIVHFATPGDYQNFAELIGQRLYERTVSVWFPAATIGTYKNKRYIDES